MLMNLCMKSAPQSETNDSTQTLSDSQWAENDTLWERRERGLQETHEEKDKIKVQEWDRERRRESVGETHSLSFIHTQEWESMIHFFYPSDGWKRLVIQSKGTDSSTFTFLFQILWTVFESVCAYVCACVRESVKVCVFALPHGLHAGRGELLYSSLRQSTAAGGHRRRLSLRCHHPHRRAMCGLPEVSCTHKHICSYINSRTACPLWLVGWFICLDSYSACLNPKPKMHNSSCFCVADIIP